MINEKYNAELIDQIIDSIIDGFITRIYGEYGYIEKTNVFVAAGHRSNFVKIKADVFSELIYNGAVKQLPAHTAEYFNGVTIGTKYVGCGYMKFPIEGVFSTEFETVQASIDDDASTEDEELICDAVERTFYDLLHEVENLYEEIQTEFWNYVRETDDE